jgi:Trk K+ transport system NAD-binding subunit
MVWRLVNKLFLLLELRLLPGLGQRLLLIGCVILFVSAGGGFVVWLADPPGTSYLSDVWWAFLHMTDPGYLGDDQGVTRRIVATSLTILGLVVFVGLLVAVITQWLQQRIVQFERGVTRVPFKNHVVILGWTNRTLTLLEELLSAAPRVRGWLRERGEMNLRVVVLDDEVDHEMQQALRDGLGDQFDSRRVLLRFGSPLKEEHLARANIGHALAVILPAVAFRDATLVSSDAQVIKTLMAASVATEGMVRRPLIVAELADPDKISIASGAYAGPLEVLATERFMGQLLAQNLRHTGLSHVFKDILTHATGNELYAPHAGELAGMPFAQARARFTDSVLLGAVTTGAACEPHLCPPPDWVIPEGARLILLARSIEECQPTTPRQLRVVAHELEPPAKSSQRPTHRILVLGWSRKLPVVIGELDRVSTGTCEIVIASTLTCEERERQLARTHRTFVRTEIRMVEAEFTSLGELQSLEPAEFDDILIVASERIDEVDESDARSVLAYLMLRKVLQDSPREPDVLVELLESDNEPLLGSMQHEVVVSPRLVSNMLTHVALRRELACVFADMFTPDGTVIEMREPREYGLSGGPFHFDVMAAQVYRGGDILMGVRMKGQMAEGGVSLNPVRDSLFSMDDIDTLVVLSREGEDGPSTPSPPSVILV